MTIVQTIWSRDTFWFWLLVTIEGTSRRIGRIGRDCYKWVIGSFGYTSIPLP